MDGRHFLVCASFRGTGAAQGICNKRNSGSLIQYLESELSDRDMDDATITATGCLKQCEKGPVMVVYPEGHWYGPITEDAIDEVLDALEEGEVAEKLRIA